MPMASRAFAAAASACVASLHPATPPLESRQRHAIGDQLLLLDDHPPVVEPIAIPNLHLGNAHQTRLAAAHDQIERDALRFADPERSDRDPMIPSVYARLELELDRHVAHRLRAQALHLARERGGEI